MESRLDGLGDEPRLSAPRPVCASVTRAMWRRAIRSVSSRLIMGIMGIVVIGQRALLPSAARRNTTNCSGSQEVMTSVAWPDSTP